jgi:hypothetical protein
MNKEHPITPPPELVQRWIIPVSERLPSTGGSPTGLIWKKQSNRGREVVGSREQNPCATGSCSGLRDARPHPDVGFPAWAERFPEVHVYGSRPRLNSGAH